MTDIQNISTLDKDILEEVKFYTKQAFPELVDSFFESAYKHMVVIEAVIKDKEHVNIGPNAHALKSISGQLGGLKFSEIAAQLEAGSETEDHEKTSALYDALKTEFPILKEALQAEVRQA